MNEAVRAVLAFLLAIGERILQKVAQGLWDELWRYVFAAVKEAEQKWEESGRGAAKKEWVLEQALKFIDERAKGQLNWLQRLILRLLIGEVVDAIIELVNEEFGHDWVAKVREVERRLAGILPLVE